jgi:C1A family cysteine protease
MSTGYIYGNRTTSTHKGAGMIVRDALEAVRKYGDVPKENFPYNVEVQEAINLYKEKEDELFQIGYPHRISQYCRINSTNAIKSALMAGNPVLMAMKWYSDMKVENGILTTSFDGYDGGHCMFIYGWNEIGWKIQNSWGLNWGINGTAIVPYEMKIEECWALTDDIVEGMTIKKPFSSNVGRHIAKIINRFCNMFEDKK